MKALSIRQPWCWLISNGWKNVENRTRSTSHRGSFLLHAAKVIDRVAEDKMLRGIHPVTGEYLVPRLHRAFCIDRERGGVKIGGIVGYAEIVDCIDMKDPHALELCPSPWFVGRYGYMLDKGRPLPFIPCQGMLGFFNPPEDVLAQARAAA